MIISLTGHVADNAVSVWSRKTLSCSRLSCGQAAVEPQGLSLRMQRMVSPMIYSAARTSSSQILTIA